MKWNEQFPKSSQPGLEQINAYVANTLWGELCGYLEESYGVKPAVEHSICGGAPGWNVKYKISGRALCTLYPGEGFFTCLVSIGSREAMEAELLLANCTDYMRKLYWQCKPFNGGRWLMIEVTSPEILADVKAMIGTRTKRKKVQNMPDISGFVEALQNRDNSVAYDCFLQLCGESKKSNSVYPYFDCFAAMMDSKNSYVRTHGLLLIAANAQWDLENKIDKIIDDYLTHVMDVKPTVSRQLIAVLPELARNKPELSADIRRALQSAQPGKYQESMAPLVQKDITKALQTIQDI